MTTRTFNALCSKLLDGTATPDEQNLFAEHAMILRLVAIESVDESDTWDRDHPYLGYRAYEDDSDIEFDALKAWQRKFTGR